MSRLSVFVAILLVLNGSFVLTESIQSHPKLAGYSEFMLGHFEIYPTLTGTWTTVGAVGKDLAKQFGLNDKCETLKDPNHCLTCTTTLYKDRNYGYKPLNDSHKDRVIKHYDGLVFKDTEGEYKCFAPDSKDQGGKGTAATFQWEDGSRHQIKNHVPFK